MAMPLADEQAKLDEPERKRQLLLIDSHERAGNLTQKTAARYRADLLERGVSIFDQPGLDGPNARKTLAAWRETELSLARTAILYPGNVIDAETRRLVALHARRGPSNDAPVSRPSSNARAPRSRQGSVRGRARAPDGDDSPLPRCRGCGLEFSPDSPRQRYHDAACSNAARQRRFKNRARADTAVVVDAALLERADRARDAIRRGADPYLALYVVIHAPTADEARDLLGVAA